PREKIGKHEVFVFQRLPHRGRNRQRSLQSRQSAHLLQLAHVVRLRRLVDQVDQRVHRRGAQGKIQKGARFSVSVAPKKAGLQVGGTQQTHGQRDPESGLVRTLFLSASERETQHQRKTGGHVALERSQDIQ